jgi:hypothetical protein
MQPPHTLSRGESYDLISNLNKAWKGQFRATHLVPLKNLISPSSKANK